MNKEINERIYGQTLNCDLQDLRPFGAAAEKKNNHSHVTYFLHFKMTSASGGSEGNISRPIDGGREEEEEEERDRER